MHKNLTILNAKLTKVLQTVRLGDVVEAVVHPVAVALNLPCLDEKKQLKEDSPCAKKRAFLNGEKAKGPSGIPRAET